MLQHMENNNQSTSHEVKIYIIPMHNMKAYEEVETKLHSFITSALDADEKSASHPSHFSPRTRAIRTK
jgi:hypothetical protein